MRTALVVALAVCLAAPAALASPEVSIEFRHHPDRSGARTTNQSLSAEDGEVEIEEEAGDREVAISDAEFAALVAMVKAAVDRFDFADGRKVRGACVEVKLEYDRDDAEVEVTYVYPAGSVPAEYVALQERWFTTPYR